MPQNNNSTVADRAKDDASDVMDTAKHGVNEVTHQTMEEARAIGGMAKDHARGLFEQTTTQLRSQADEQTTRAAGGLEQLAGQVRALLDGRPEDAGPVRDYAQDLGDRAQQLAQHLRTRGVDGVIADTGRFARRRPGLFLAGAAAAGFLAGRLVKAQRSDASNGAMRQNGAQQAPMRSTSGNAGYPESGYPTAGFRTTPGGPPPLPDATTPPAADAIPSTGAGERYGTSHASEPERW